MQSADKIIFNAKVLTMDENYQVFNPGAVAILGDVIQAVGPQAEILETYSAPETLDCKGKVVMPGLVNAHTHVPMSLLRGLADDLRLDVWLLGYMMPVEREFVSPEFVRLGTQLACAELIRGGVTTFNDMYYFEDDVARAAANAGMRAVCGQTVLKFPAPDASSYEESLEKARQFIASWKNHPLITPAVAPHAPYTCTSEILRACTELALEFDAPLHIHIAETATEVETSQKEHNASVVRYVENQELLRAKVIAAHCVHIDQPEMKILKKHNTGVAHNPSSNLKLASGFAPVAQMLAEGLNVGIGTDGAASNNDLDMFEEVRLASFLAKATTNDPTRLPAKTSLAMATRIGANALHIGQTTGSLTPGKRADLITVSISPIHNLPQFQRDPDNLYAQIVYASKATDVWDVMVNGQWLMRDQTLLTLNEEELVAEAASYAEKIDHFLIKREKSLLSKLLAIEWASQEESFEVQAKVRISNRNEALEKIQQSNIEILYERHYRQYDSYFIFDDLEQGYLRHREDNFVDAQNKVTEARYRLTLLGPTREYEFPQDVLLSRSRFIAPASHSMRFYKDYFKPSQVVGLEKDRLRWRVLFQGLEFYINLDHFENPDLGDFLEVKSRTWSRKDAEHKSEVVIELLAYLGCSSEKPMSDDYLGVILTKSGKQHA